MEYTPIFLGEQTNTTDIPATVAKRLHIDPFQRVEDDETLDKLIHELSQLVALTINVRWDKTIKN